MPCQAHTTIRYQKAHCAIRCHHHLISSRLRKAHGHFSYSIPVYVLPLPVVARSHQPREILELGIPSARFLAICQDLSYELIIRIWQDNVFPKLVCGEAPATLHCDWTFWQAFMLVLDNNLIIFDGSPHQCSSGRVRPVTHQIQEHDHELSLVRVAKLPLSNSVIYTWRRQGVFHFAHHVNGAPVWIQKEYRSAFLHQINVRLVLICHCCEASYS
mmetsp:Transcript_73956/g.135196  ORF Transcript_73956/g.135196 Transcript_73956/m.135196 type:complete len:215 (-) Transcript_73956:27-671(-)